MSDQPPEPPQSPPPDQQVAALLKVFRRFMFPFLFSWAVAYVGSSRGSDWMHFAGLGGVGLSIIGLLLWLLHR